MGQPEPLLGEGPREGRNQATGSLPCCSCGGRGGVSPVAVPLFLSQVFKPRLRPPGAPLGSQPGPDLPRGPNACSPPEGAAGGRGPSHVGGPYVFFLPRRYSSDLRAGWADGGSLVPSGRARVTPHRGHASHLVLPAPFGSRRSLSDRDPRVGHSPGPPRASRCFPGLPQSQPGRAFLAAAAIFVSSPVVGRIAAQARGV
ncbi:hypothetical protein NDU88_003019 [Pleurodeles waltl]|uniref:Uncharacterized protein n=1 Tax=Pleurodeles waltl TaxID=8319 RepID=A0AAV7W3J1_PLEWA|nr:hypothetical protein NDU88_003019 [Pleurodeles waltl]